MEAWQHIFFIFLAVNQLKDFLALENISDRCENLDKIEKKQKHT